VETPGPLPLLRPGLLETTSKAVPVPWAPLLIPTRGPGVVVNVPGYEPQPLPPPGVVSRLVSFVDGLDDSECVYLVWLLNDLQEVDPI
jgi:hypothetical protein